MNELVIQTHLYITIQPLGLVLLVFIPSSGLYAHILPGTISHHTRLDLCLVITQEKGRRK